MSPTRAWSWSLGQLCVVVLALACLNILLMKQLGLGTVTLALLLAGIYGLVVLSRWQSRGQPASSRGRYQAALAEVDVAGLLLLAALLVLVLLFHIYFMRASGDGREYFVHVRSALIDWDLDFSNDVATFRTGGMPHIYPFGSAVLWAPFFLLAHLWLGVLNLFGGDFVRSGFANPYQRAIGLGTLTYGALGFFLIFRMLREYFSRAVATLVAIALCFGTFMLWYLTVEASYSHGTSFFSTTLFVYLWHRSRGERSRRQWLTLGLAGGLMTMVRWQNAIFLALPAAEALIRGARFWRGSRTPGWRATLTNQAIFGAGLLVGFFPQMLFWKVVNGGWLALPHRQTGQQWWSDSLMRDVLFSANHGLFTWHPVLYLAVLGIPLFLKRDRLLGSLLALVFFAQVYINGAVAMWWGGSAFGARRFDSCMLLFAFGLAALITWIQKRPLAGVAVVLSVFVICNAFLLIDVRDNVLLSGEGITFDRMIDSAYRRTGNPFSFPANILFAWKYASTLHDYDQLGARLFNNVHIDVGSEGDEKFLGRGWGGREAGPDYAFRWAVTRESTIVVPLKAPLVLRPGDVQEQAAYRLRFRARPFRYPDAPTQSIEVWVNGRHLTTRELAPGMHEYQIEIPGRFLRRNLNGVRLRYAYARSPREAGLAEDSRPLAAQFDSIEFLRR